MANLAPLRRWNRGFTRVTFRKCLINRLCRQFAHRQGNLGSIGLRHCETFQRNYLDQLFGDELLERTIPEKPTSRLQKYRLTDKGRAVLEQMKTRGGNS